MTTTNQIKKETKRCLCCAKKVGLNYFTCKCNNSAYFCEQHKYPFEHNCSVNTHNTNKSILTTGLVKLTKDKIQDRI